VATKHPATKAASNVEKPSEDDLRAARVRELLGRLGMTQMALADASGGAFTREAANKIANGVNKATTVKIVQGLAVAFGLEVQDMIDFLDGKLSVADAIARRGRPKGPRIESPSGRYTNLEAAVIYARASNMREDAIREVESVSLDATQDLTVDDYVAMIRTVAARMKRDEAAPHLAAEREAQSASAIKQAREEHKAAKAAKASR